MLNVSENLKLPLDFVTQACAILARRGAGKSYTASVLAEELLMKGLQVCVLDPIGVWWGLRSSADGNSEGLPIVIFGGDHGDLPLDSSAGTLIADVVIEKKVSALIDLSLMRKAEQDRFTTDFAERLYHKNRAPLHLIVDEADAFAPQRPMPGQQRMLGAMEDLVRRGRARGIGITMVTQRSAVINKNLLSQAEILIALQTIAPQDRAAVEWWVEAHGTPEQCKTMMDSLAGLPIGTAWVWSPSWAKCFKCVEIRKRQTFDSSATPKIGRAVKAPKKLAPVELDQLKTQMSAIIEQKKAEDPRELRKKIAELQKQVSEKKPSEPKVVEIRVPDAKAINELRDLLTTIDKRMVALLKVPSKLLNTPASSSPAAKQMASTFKPMQPGRRISRVPGEIETLSRCERNILIVLAQYAQGRTKNQVAVISGYAVNSGNFNNSLSHLRSQEFIQGFETLMITSTGIEALGSFDPLPTGKELAQHWMGKLGCCERAILKFLIDCYPQTTGKSNVASGTGYAENSGNFNNSLSRLRTLELIEGRAELKASDNLF